MTTEADASSKPCDETATKETITLWLTEKGDGDGIIDLEWTVEEEGDGSIISASHEKIPFVMGVQFFDRFANIILFTGVETATMENDTRLEIYRKLLIFNDERPLVKAILTSRNDVIAFRTDLDLVSLSRDEFNDGIISLLIAYQALSTEIMEISPDEMMDKLVEIITNELKSKSQEEVVQMLVDKAGISKEEADELVKRIADQLGIKPAPANLYH